MLAAFHEVVFLSNVWHEKVWLPYSSTGWYAMIAATAWLCHSTKMMQMSVSLVAEFMVANAEVRDAKALGGMHTDTQSKQASLTA
jgi:hypothetical protein